MDNLLKQRVDSSKEIEKERRKRKRRQKKSEPVVIYTPTGKIKRKAVPAWKKAGLITLTIIGGLAAFIYIPPYFTKTASVSNQFVITPEQQAIKGYMSILQSSPEQDFDGDGLSNQQEAEYGTDPWMIDTDTDGISDYAELFVTKTQPTIASSTLVDEVMNWDKKNGSNLGTPYKIDDIIFWPDDYRSKAYGGVVKTIQGYRIWNYKGWVQFPHDYYAYAYSNGINTEIPSKTLTYENGTTSRAWHIDSYNEIRFYDAPLRFVVRLRLPLANNLYLTDDGFTRFLTRVLPSEGGLVNCKRMADIDTQPDTSEPVTAPIVMPFIKKDDYSRLTKNSNTLKDLSYVYKNIDAGECVAISLYSGKVGESIGIVYGYTKDGDLLVADTNLAPVGELNIIERAMRMMNKDGDIGQVSWYEFRGLGFDSIRNGDRISVFSSTRTRAEDEETTPQTDAKDMEG